jgi:fatty-acyl-CoA synthase
MPDSGVVESTSLRNELSPWNLDDLAPLWPQRVALIDPGRGIRYTYKDLQNRSRAVAGGLHEMGVRRGDRVAMLAQTAAPALDLLFACARLGAILAPLNWRLTRRELEGVVRDVDSGVIVAGLEFVDQARDVAPAAKIIGLEGTSTSFNDLLGSQLEAANETVRMSDPWLILYTGGTTGTPKGAVLTHGSVAWNSINTAVSWGLSQEDCGPVFTPTFHTGFWNVFTLPLLLLGGCVIIPDRFEPREALKTIARERPTIVFLVPTMFQLVSEQPEFDEADFSSVRWAISGGAPLPMPVRERWKTKVPLFKQGYGLTEVGPNNFATPDEASSAKAGSVGRLTMFARAKIVDDDGRDTGLDPGELLLSGPHMCAGYWRNPDATADAIRDGWFHTGDVARRDEDGYFFIVDRKKDMVITGGENVYPSEVESVLYTHPAVREVAVVGVPDLKWGESVTAVLSLQDRTAVTGGELREYARGQLAGYKVPKRFVVVDDVPKSGANKISRAVCRKIAVERLRAEGER